MSDDAKEVYANAIRDRADQPYSVDERLADLHRRLEKLETTEEGRQMSLSGGGKLEAPITGYEELRERIASQQQRLESLETKLASSLSVVSRLTSVEFKIDNMKTWLADEAVGIARRFTTHNARLDKLETAKEGRQMSEIPITAFNTLVQKNCELAERVQKLENLVIDSKPKTPSNDKKTGIAGLKITLPETMTSEWFTNERPDVQQYLIRGWAEKAVFSTVIKHGPNNANHNKQFHEILWNAQRAHFEAEKQNWELVTYHFRMAGHNAMLCGTSHEIWEELAQLVGLMVKP